MSKDKVEPSEVSERVSDETLTDTPATPGVLARARAAARADPTGPLLRTVGQTVRPNYGEVIGSASIKPDFETIAAALAGIQSDSRLAGRSVLDRVMPDLGTIAGRSVLDGVMPDLGTIAGRSVLDGVMPDLGTIAGRSVLDGVMPDLGTIAGRSVLDGVMPDLGTIAGRSVLDGVMPDLGTIAAGLSVLDGIMPDYGKTIGGISIVESCMPDYTKLAGSLSILQDQVPDYSKALVGLSFLDVLAFQPQHALLQEAVGLGGAQTGFAAQAAQILSSQDSLSQLMTTAIGAAARTDLYSTLGQFGLVQAHLGSLSIKPEPAPMLRGATRLPGRYYDTYLEGLPPRPIARRADVARFAGSAQTGLLVAECLTSVELTDDDRDNLASQLTAAVELLPWQTGPAAARDDLFLALAEVDTDLPEWLKGAWEDITRDGVKAVSKVAHCTIECIDRTLRALAPVDELMRWIADVGAKPGWLDGNPKRPTRRARVMYVMRERSARDAKLAASQVESLAALVQDVAGALQAVKHSEAPTMTIMRGWVMATEGALSQLLLHR